MEHVQLRNSTFIGTHAGADLTHGEGIVIIGDNIRDLDKNQEGPVIFIGDKMAIGKTVLGKPCNLYDILFPYYNSTHNRIGRMKNTGIRSDADMSLKGEMTIFEELQSTIERRTKHNFYFDKLGGDVGAWLKALCDILDERLSEPTPLSHVPGVNIAVGPECGRAIRRAKDSIPIGVGEGANSVSATIGEDPGSYVYDSKDHVIFGEDPGSYVYTGKDYVTIGDSASTCDISTGKLTKKFKCIACKSDNSGTSNAGTCTLTIHKINEYNMIDTNMLLCPLRFDANFKEEQNNDKP